VLRRTVKQLLHSILGSDKYGIKLDAYDRSGYISYLDSVVEIANTSGKSAIDALSPAKYSQVRPSTITGSGGGLWKRINENWEIADFLARTPESFATAKDSAVFDWLAANEMFLLQIADESGVWRDWIERGLSSTPRTSFFDHRFDWTYGGNAYQRSKELSPALAEHLKAITTRYEVPGTARSHNSFTIQKINSVPVWLVRHAMTCQQCIEALLTWRANTNAKCNIQSLCAPSMQQAKSELSQDNETWSSETVRLNDAIEYNPDYDGEFAIV
jgi:hypothetical protein